MDSFLVRLPDHPAMLDVDRRNDLALAKLWRSQHLDERPDIDSEE
jgi:hypothetical protein